MKRDLDLVKKILLHIEAQEHMEPKITIAGYDDKLVWYNVMLMEQAGLVEAIVHKLLDGTVEAIPKRMTWQGHEWLDLARNDSTWKKAKKSLKDKSVTASFEVMKFLLIELTKQALLPNHPH